MSNNVALGGATPHNEKIAEVLVRSKGDEATASAMASKTRSPFKGTDKHNHWESAGEGWGGNVER